MKFDICTGTWYRYQMIRCFKHQGLKRLFQKGDRSKVNADHLARIEDILARLDIAETADFLDLPGYNLHQLRGNLKRFWSVRISGNWRIIFRISDGDVYDVDLVDYH